MNHITGFNLADIRGGGVGVARLLIAPFSERKELQLARIAVDYVISLKMAQK